MALSTTPFALAVDDDPLILMDTRDILEEAGYRCHDAGDGDTARQLLVDRNEEITLLFSDVEMPGETDGFALARHVAEHYPWIDIIIASGRVKPGPGDMPEKATFIGKPYSAQMIHDHLREMLPDGKKPEALKTAAWPSKLLPWTIRKGTLRSLGSPDPVHVRPCLRQTVGETPCTVDRSSASHSAPSVPSSAEDTSSSR